MASSVETPPAEAGLDHSSEDDLSSQDVRTRAVRGATMFVGRDVLVQFIGFATGLVLARLLTPADFGITTLGLTIVGAANVIADGGIAASLISRKEPPTTAELRAVNGFQLALTLAITAIAVPIGFALGGDGPATAIILLSLPLYAVRTPPMLLFERRLQFAPRIIIQVAELVTYGVVAITLALMGLGVWAMPLALVARAAAGTVYCYVLSPTKWVLPTLRFRLVRPLLGFGVRFQMKSIVQLVRDIAVVSVVGSLGGLQSLGFYGFCIRLLNIPKTAATALGEVTFPAFSRLIGNGEDVGPILKRTTLTSSLINALTIAPLVAASPALIAFFFGDKWTDASLALPGLGIGLIVGGPLGWNVVNYLYATGRLEDAPVDQRRPERDRDDRVRRSRRQILRIGGPRRGHRRRPTRDHSPAPVARAATRRSESVAGVPGAGGQRVRVDGLRLVDLHDAERHAAGRDRRVARGACAPGPARLAHRPRRAQDVLVDDQARHSARASGAPDTATLS